MWMARGRGRARGIQMSLYVRVGEGGRERGREGATAKEEEKHI